MISSPTEITAASAPPVARIVIEATEGTLEYIEVERGDDGAGIDIWRYAHEDDVAATCSLLALTDDQGAEMARAVLAIADPGSVTLSAAQAARLAQLAGMVESVQPCKAFYENDEVVLELRGIAAELRRMSGRGRLAVVR